MSMAAKFEIDDRTYILAPDTVVPVIDIPQAVDLACGQRYATIIGLPNNGTLSATQDHPEAQALIDYTKGKAFPTQVVYMRVELMPDASGDGQESLQQTLTIPQQLLESK